MSMQIILNKENLTEDEERYINERNDLRMLREQHIANGGDMLSDADIDGIDDEADEEEEAISVEEYVADPTTTKADIVRELRQLPGEKVEFDPKSPKDELAALLVSEVQKRRD